MYKFPFVPLCLRVLSGFRVMILVVTIDRKLFVVAGCLNPSRLRLSEVNNDPRNHIGRTQFRPELEATTVRIYVGAEENETRITRRADKSSRHEGPNDIGRQEFALEIITLSSFHSQNYLNCLDQHRKINKRSQVFDIVEIVLQFNESIFSR